MYSKHPLERLRTELRFLHASDVEEHAGPRLRPRMGSRRHLGVPRARRDNADPVIVRGSERLRGMIISGSDLYLASQTRWFVMAQVWVKLIGCAARPTANVAKANRLVRSDLECSLVIPSCDSGQVVYSERPNGSCGCPSSKPSAIERELCGLASD